MTDPTQPRTCSKCPATKHSTDYYRHTAGSDRLRGECKGCTRSAAKARYAENRDDILPRKAAYAHAALALRRAREKERRARNGEAIRAYQKGWRERNRERVNAGARERYHARKKARKRGRDPPGTAPQSHRIARDDRNDR